MDRNPQELYRDNKVVILTDGFPDPAPDFTQTIRIVEKTAAKIDQALGKNPYGKNRKARRRLEAEQRRADRKGKKKK